MTNLRRDLLDGIDKVHREHDGRTPDHVILPRSMKDEVSLETLGPDRAYSVNRVNGRGLMGMQVWFSAALDERDKIALLMSDEAFIQLFSRTKDFCED